jgi:Spy/CpxP family protein refolding chaperone
MKQVMNKTRLLIWIIIILVAVNVAAIISGLVFSSERRNELPVRTDIPYNRRADFFRGQLGLNNAQKQRFTTFNREFNQRARAITGKMNSLRYQLVEEMAGSHPDRARLDSICVGIGHLHTELKRATVDYYMNMKSVCTPDQQVELNRLFERIINADNDESMRPGRGRPNRAPGMGRGRQGQNRSMFN